MINVYATCVSLNGKGILLLGKTGSGKSDLALRLIEQTGAILVADDRTDLQIKNNEITACCPNKIKGLLEVRGIGIIKKKYRQKAKIHLVVELVENRQEVDRLPEEDFWEFEKIKVRKIKLYPFDASTPYKIKTACDEIR